MRTLLSILVLLALPRMGLGQDASETVKDDAAKPAAAKPEEPVAAAPAAVLPPKAGSHVAQDDNYLCLQCHQDQDPNDPATRRLFVDPKRLAEDVHWKNGVNCHDCHGGDYKTAQVNEAHAKESGFRGAGEAARKMCAVCHDHQALELVKGVHAKAGEKDEQGRGTLLECRKCHGAIPHAILPVHDSRSPVFVDHQLQTCGQCHEKELATYRETSHYHGLEKSGLLLTAVCATATAPTASSEPRTTGQPCLPGTWPPLAASATVISPNGCKPASTAEATGRAEPRRERRREESRGSILAARRAIKATRSPWPPQSDFASRCRTSAAIVTAGSPRVTR